MKTHRRYIDSYPRRLSKRVAPKTRIHVAPGVRAHFDGKQSIVFTVKVGKYITGIVVPYSGMAKACRLFVQRNKHRFLLAAHYKCPLDVKLDRRLTKAAGQKPDGSNVWLRKKLRYVYFEFKTQAAMDRAVKRMSKLGVKVTTRDDGEWVC